MWFSGHTLTFTSLKVLAPLVWEVRIMFKADSHLQQAVSVQVSLSMEEGSYFFVF